MVFWEFLGLHKAYHLNLKFLGKISISLYHVFNLLNAKVYFFKHVFNNFSELLVELQYLSPLLSTFITMCTIC